MKRTLSILLSLCMLLSITAGLDFSAYAATLTPFDKALNEIRQNIRIHNPEFTVDVTGVSSNDRSRIWKEIYAHTGVPDEGDYLYFSGNSLNAYRSGNTLYFKPTYKLTYEQELAINNKIAELKVEFDIDDKSDYIKLCTIYDYICTNVEYDYDHYNGIVYNPYAYIVYGALIENKCVCQGYAVLLYRLCLEFGIDARVILGTAVSKGGHAWNIVKMDGKYYYCDSTWDAGYGEYTWFLKGKKNFGHIPDDSERENEILSTYDISDDDYVPKYPGIRASFDNNKVYTSGNYQYLLNPTGYAKLVKYIGNEKNVTIPSKLGKYKVIEIDKDVFDNNQVVETVVISEGIKIIGWSGTAFNNCKKLKSITFPSTLRDLGGMVSSDCDSFTDFYVPSDNKYYSSENGVLFNKDKTSLIAYPVGNNAKKYVIPNTVKYIYSDAFRDNKYIEEIVISNKVEKIQYGQFWDCTSLKNVTIPGTVKVIGALAFYNCTSLESISLPESISEIGYGVFEDCTSLKNITIPSAVTEIDNYTFYNCTSLKSITIPSTVKEIGENVFYNCTSLESVSLPESISKISYGAFEYCTSLKNITIPSAVTEIGNYGFYGCTSLKSITIPSNVTEIGNYGFWGCTSLKNITIPSTVTKIGKRAFEYDINIIGIPGSYAEQYANENELYFWNINDKTKSGTSNGVKWQLTIDGDFTVTGNGDFNNDEQWTKYKSLIKTVNIGEGIKKLNADFAYCDIQSVTLPNSLTEISNCCFEYTDIKSITIPKNVAVIGYYAFYSCDNLESINVSSENKKYSSVDGVLFNYSKTDLIKYPSGKASTQYSIPKGVTTIDYDAFSNVKKLKQINIPSSVEEIYYEAFSDTGITDVYYEGSEIEWNSIYIYDYNDDLLNATIHYGRTTCGHRFNSGEVTKEPTCVENGIMTYTCVICNATKTEVIKSNDQHEYDSSEIVKPATCTENGTIKYTCKLCGKNVTEATDKDKSNHSFNEGTCVRCGVECKKINLNTNTKVNISESAERCYFMFIPESDGILTFYSISNYDTVGYIYDSQMNELYYNDDGYYNDNNYYDFRLEFEVVKGKTYYLACSIYYEDETGEFDVRAEFEEKEQEHQHNYVYEVVAPTCTQKGYTIVSCNCGDNEIADYVPATGHSWGSGKVTKNATCTTNGIKTYTCNNCNATKTEKIIATGHKTKTVTTKATYAKAGKVETKCTVCGSVTSKKTLAKLTVPKITLSSVKSKKSKQITVTWKKNTKVTGYEIQYSTNKSFKKNVKKTAISKNSTTSKTISKLTGGKKYYVRVRAYKVENGKKYYSSWSSAKSVTVKK